MKKLLTALSFLLLCMFAKSQTHCFTLITDESWIVTENPGTGWEQPGYNANWPAATYVADDTYPYYNSTISPRGKGMSVPSPTGAVYLRRTFYIGSNITNVWINFSSRCRYDIYVNGVFINESFDNPNKPRGYNASIAAYLVTGNNTIAVKASDALYLGAVGWLQGEMYDLAGGAPGISASSNQIPDCGTPPTNITLTTSSGISGWHWYQGSCGGTAIGTGSSINVSPSITTTYYARSEGGCFGNGNCGSITIFGNTITDVNISANSSGAICSGTNVTFNASVPSVPSGNGLTYQWKLNDADVGANSPVYSNSSLVNNDVVKCVVSNSCNTITSNSIPMSVYSASSQPPTSVSTNEVDNIICTGSDITLTANGAVPVNGAVYRWYEGSCSGTLLGTGQSITITPSTGQHNYFVNLQESVCNTACVNVSVLVNPAITNVAVTSNATGTICAGTNVTFTAAVSNGGIGGVYQWQLNDVNVGINSPFYSNAALLNNQVVKCEVTNGCNTVTSNEITMSVNQLPTSVSISTFNNQSTTICQGGYIGFVTTGTTNAGAQPTFRWKKNGIVVQTYPNAFSAYSFYDTYNLNNNDIITCEMISQLGCTLPVTSNPITVTVNPINNTSISIAVSTGTNPDCSGDPLTFTATPTNGGSNPTYEWHLISYFPYSNNIVGTNSPTFTLTDPHYNDIVSCYMTSSTVCSNPVTAISNDITVKVPVQFDGNISCPGSSGNTVSTCAGATIPFYAYTSNSVATNNGTIGFPNTSPVYQWKLNGNNVGTNLSTYTQTGFADGDLITCDVSSTEPCATPASLTLSMTVSVYDVTTATLSVDGPSEVCAGTLPTYYAYPNNAGPNPSYQWKKNGLDVGLNQSYYTPDALATADVIACVLTTDPVCAAPITIPSGNSIVVTVIPSVTPTISIVASNPITASANVFTATITNGGSNPFYQWTKNAVNVGINSSSYPDLALLPGDIITCTLSSDAQCASPATLASNILTVPAFCTPTSQGGYQPCSYTWITNVQLGTTLNKTTVCNGFYSNFTNTDTLKAGAGETVSYSLTGGSDGTNWYQRRAIYIDFNNDRDFDDAGEMLVDIGAGALDITTGSFTLPASLAGGSYRIRVVGSLDNNFSPCNNDGGEAEDYTLLITYCTPHSPNGNTACQYYFTSNVTLGTTVNNSTGCNGFYSDFSTSQILTAAAGETVSFSISLGSIDGQNWGSAFNIFIDYNNDGDFNDAGEKVVTNVDAYIGSPATGSFTLPSLLGFGSYRIRVINAQSGNACELDYGEAEDYTLLIPEPVYCIPVISQSCDMWIANITIGSINNTTAQPTVCTAGGYTDYSSLLSTTAAPGATVNFSLTGGTNTFSQWQYADIYVDFNNDGDFDDADENVVTNFSFYAGFPYTGSFNIPANQPYGYYRIRVKSYESTETQTGSCGYNTNGEVEDYRLIITCVPNGSNVVIQGNNIDIADGDITPDIADNTDFGNVNLNANEVRTFTIKNNGTGPLQITGNPTFSGGFQYYFSILNYPTSYLLQPGGSTNFTVQVNMPSWAVIILLVPLCMCQQIIAIRKIMILSSRLLAVALQARILMCRAMALM